METAGLRPQIASQRAPDVIVETSTVYTKMGMYLLVNRCKYMDVCVCLALWLCFVFVILYYCSIVVLCAH